jgi:hypothetical protein
VRALAEVVDRPAIDVADDTSRNAIRIYGLHG